MTSGRKLQFHHPDPIWVRASRRNRAFGQDDGMDYVDAPPPDVTPLPDTTTVDTLTVVASPPSPSTIDITPLPQALPDPIVLAPPASLDLGPLTTNLPTLNILPQQPNPLSNFLNKLFPPKAKASGGGGGGGGGAASAPKLQPSSQVKPATTAATATGLNPMVLWGAGAAGIILLAALFSGGHHHGRR